MDVVPSKKKSIGIFIIILCAIAGGYYVLQSTGGSLEYECANVYMYSDSIHTYSQFLNTGNNEVSLSELEISVSVKPKNEDAILIGHRQISGFIQIPLNHIYETELWADANYDELYDYYEAKNIVYPSDQYVEFSQNAIVIIQISGKLHYDSRTSRVSYEDTIPWNNIG